MGLRRSTPVWPIRTVRRSSLSAAPGRIGAVPLASVIVVCWNSAGVLGRCLDQLLAQDHANYEVIVVDDGSEDNTLEVAVETAAHRELDDRAQPGQ